MPASAGSAAVTTPAAAPKAAAEAVALPAESTRTESVPEQTAPVENAALTEPSGEVYGPVRDLFKPDESSSGLDGVDQIMQDALDSPLLAASSSISPQAELVYNDRHIPGHNHGPHCAQKPIQLV